MHKLLINPPFLLRNINKYKILGRRYFPVIQTCNIINIFDIECTNNKYNRCDIYGYKLLNNYKTTRIDINYNYNDNNDNINNINNKSILRIINFSCYESTILYFKLYNKDKENIFNLKYNSCKLSNKGYFKIKNNNEYLLIKYNTEKKKDLHFYPNNNIKEHKLELQDNNIKIKYIIEDFYYISNRIMYTKNIYNDINIYNNINHNNINNINNNNINNINHNNINNINYNYLGYFMINDINHKYKDIMIRWNTYYIKYCNNKLLSHTLIIKFIKEELKESDTLKLDFIYLFYSKHLITRSDLIEIVNGSI